MSAPGWYPDPGGASGKFRYWTGSTWSAALSSDPDAAPPGGGIGSLPSRSLGNPAFGQEGYVPGTAYAGTTPQRRRAVGPWLLLAVGVVVIAVVGAFVIRTLIAGTVGGGGSAVGQATTNPCPVNKTNSYTPPPRPADGRVYGGHLSYPRLGSPWRAPHVDDRLAYGRDVHEQFLVTEENYQPGRSWGASVLVAELAAGDGFYTPEEGSEIVMKCITGAYYGDAKVGRQDLVNQATTVDGKEAWLMESHLTFDIQGLKAKGELIIIIIVRTSAESSSLYYASVPDNAKEHEQTVRDLIPQLKVTA